MINESWCEIAQLKRISGVYKLLVNWYNQQRHLVTYAGADEASSSLSGIPRCPLLITIAKVTSASGELQNPTNHFFKKNVSNRHCVSRMSRYSSTGGGKRKMNKLDNRISENRRINIKVTLK